MALSLEEGIALTKQIWKDSLHPGGTWKPVGLNALQHYLDENHLEYSHKEAVAWVLQNQETWDKNKFIGFRKAIFELNDVMLYGEIRGNYRYHETPFDLLAKEWQDLLTAFYHDLRNSITHRCARVQILHCVPMVGFFESEGIFDPSEITVKVLSGYYDFAEAIGDGYICMYSCRNFLEFLSRKGYFPFYRTMVLSAPVQAKGGGYALGNTDITEVRRINASVSDLRLTSADFLKRSADLVVYLEREYEYDKTSLRNNYTVHFQMFYIFISEAGVDYTPDIAAYWLEVMRDFPKPVGFGMARESAMHAIRVFIEKAGVFSVFDDALSHRNPGKISKMPEWSAALMDAFLKFCLDEGKGIATVDQHKSAAISFFLFASERGVDSPDKLTPQLIKDYNVMVSNTFPSGKNHYRYSIRQLLLYLFENGYTDRNLSLSLPSQSAKSRKIIEVLTEDEVNRIYDYCGNPSTALELRDSCLLLAGLLMGLRGVDIINLCFSDIDWKRQAISITQQKTYRPLVQPMPAAVGNRIYLYLKSGRHESDSKYVFLSTKAPYCRAHHSSCKAALQRSIGRADFHVLRRTFATRLLNAGVGSDQIKDSLGHSTMDTVHRYLSVEEKGMRECCLPLERTVIL